MNETVKYSGVHRGWTILYCTLVAARMKCLTLVTLLRASINSFYGPSHGKTHKKISINTVWSTEISACTWIH